MAQGEGLETQPGAKFVIPGRTDQEHVLVPDSVHALAVDAGLVGKDHTGLQGDTVEILPQFLRTFVIVEEEAHAVTGSVAEVALGLP